MSRTSRALVALVAALAVGCDDQVPTEVQGPDPLDPAVPPHLLSTYPPDGGVGPFDLYRPAGQLRPHFMLRFDKLIDPYRFESRWLRMEGFDAPVGFRLTTGTLSDVLAVAAYDSVTRAPVFYDIGRTYTVTVDTTLRDATGNHPAMPQSFSFVPEPHFRVVDVLFEHGLRVSAYDRVRLTWNGAAASGTEASIHFDPPIQGSWSPLGDSWIFTHGQPFAFRTSYVLQVDESAMDTQGNHMAGPFTTTFHTRPFEILATDPRDGWSGVWPASRRIFVAVSGPADTTTVAAAFAIEPALAGRFVWGTTSFAFQSTADLQPSTSYRIEISTSLRALDGTALEVPYVFAFATDTFRVYDTRPYPGAPDVPFGTTIEARFNMELDPATIEPAFAIVPSIPGRFAMPDRGVLQFTPDALLAPSTLYEVTISTLLRAANGAAFPAPYTFSFTTLVP